MDQSQESSSSPPPPPSLPSSPLSELQSQTSRQVVRLRIQQPPSELPPNPPEDNTTDLPQPLLLPPKSSSESNLSPNRRFKLYIKESDHSNPLRDGFRIDDDDDDDDDEVTELEVPFSPPAYRGHEENENDFDVFDVNKDIENENNNNNCINNNNNNVNSDDDDGDDDGKEEKEPKTITSTTAATTMTTKKSSSSSHILTPRPNSVAVKGHETSFIRNEEPPKEEALQEFVESIVKGRVEIAHTITPDELTGTNTNLGIGGSGSVVK